MSNKTVLELFAGAGGMALGLEKSGFSTVGLIEKDKNASNTLRINRPNWNVIEGDIIDITSNGIKNFIKIDVDLVSGGFPCQSFSYAGKRLGLEDVRGTMFYYYSKVVEDIKPKMFVFENVKGLISHDNGDTFKTIKQVLIDKGYILYWQLLNAWDYNVAQKRERIFVVGVRENFWYSDFVFPNKISPKLSLKDVLINVPSSPGVLYPESKIKVLDQVPPGGCWRDLPSSIAKDYMGKSYFLGGGKTGMARRLSWDEPSLTLTTSPAQKQTERCHPDETRPFTTREYARIQAFPDNWIFSGSTLSVYKQIGNAVPVNLAKYVGKNILDYLLKGDKKC